MLFIAQNNLQFILEFAILLQIAIILLFNLFNISLSRVLFFSLVLVGGLTFLFSFDALALFIHFLGLHEFVHTYGPIALMGVITAWAALSVMQETGIGVQSIKRLIILLIILITVVGVMVHRDFLFLWGVGLMFGFILISKSFRQKSFLSIKKVVGAILATILGLSFLEGLSNIFSMPVLSPSLRIQRILENAIPSLQLVIHNTTLWGHIPGSSYWGLLDLGSSSGYISLPISFILTFGLPYQIFTGVLVNQKDIIDYFVPGIFGIAFDFGYIVMILTLIWCVFVVVLGLKILTMYRDKREKGSKRFLGREALLIGSLSAFAAQAIYGLFVINREINGTALVTFIFLSGLILAHVITIKKN